jgi:hypothetical protein
MSNIIRKWNGRIIRVREDRYVSLTDMAQASGNRVDNWFRLNGTTNYLSALSKATGLPVKSPFPQKSVTAGNQGFQPLVEIIQGGVPENQGTWGHPKVALRFAQWCSDDFAVQVDMWIDELLTTGSVSLAQSSQRQILGAYQERVNTMFDDANKIPAGYWCVLHESANLLIWVESKLKCPVDQADLLDGSIGTHWSNKRKGQPWAGDRIKFEYRFPNRITVYPWCYQMKELEHFRLFLDGEYRGKLLPQYLHKKYPGIIKL